MNIQDWFTTHTHYWGVPHKAEGEDRFVHECYECGKQRESILGMSPASERPDDSNPSRVVTAEGKLANTKN